MNTTKSEYDFYKLKKWVDSSRLQWWQLLVESESIYFIEKHIYLIDSEEKKRLLSRNSFAVDILRKYPDKISWNDIVTNKKAIHVIEENLDLCIKSLNWKGKIDLLNHPDFTYIIEKHTDKILDNMICLNCLPIIASNKNIVYIDLLDKYLLKYPNKIPIPTCNYFWDGLANNPIAIHIIKKYLHHLPNSSWQSLASNPNAISIIEENLDKLKELGWNNLSNNPNAIPILKKNLDKINWYKLCNNKNAIEILEECPEKILCYSFIDYKNFSINAPIFELDYDAIKKRCDIYKEELIETALHPSRIEKYFQQGISIGELDNYI
jgi:hypothetical protein